MPHLLVTWVLLWMWVAGSLAGCGGAQAGRAPAATGVTALITALSADDPHRAYDLLTDDVKRTVSYQEFAAQWRQTAAERAWQTEALRASLRGAPDVGERAIVGFADGKTVPLERDGKTWRVEVPLITRAQTPHPRDAVRLFAEALADRDVSAALALLSKRRRDGLSRQIEGFLRGLSQRLDQPIDEYDTDRAELRWDEDGLRYRLLLRREDEEWRIDDVSIRPSPGDDPEADSEDE